MVELLLKSWAVMRKQNVDRQTRPKPAIYVHRFGAAHSYPEPGSHFEDADGHLPEYQYSCDRGGLDLYRPQPGRD